MALAEKILFAWFAIFVIWVRVYLIHRFRRVRAIMWTFVVELVGWVVAIIGIGTSREPLSTVALFGGVGVVLFSSFVGVLAGRRHKDELKQLLEKIEREQME